MGRRSDRENEGTASAQGFWEPAPRRQKRAGPLWRVFRALFRKNQVDEVGAVLLFNVLQGCARHSAAHSATCTVDHLHTTSVACFCTTAAAGRIVMARSCLMCMFQHYTLTYGTNKALRVRNSQGKITMFDDRRRATYSKHIPLGMVLCLRGRRILTLT